MMGSTEKEEEEEDFDEEEEEEDGFELPGNSCLREAFAEMMML